MEKILRIYDLNLPKAPPKEIEKSSGSVRTITWLHSDQTIIGSCTDMGGVRLWDVRTSTVVWTLETKSYVTSAEVSQDGRYITTANGSSVKFWDANHFGLLKSHDMPCVIESASLEPNHGNKFIARGEDMWIRVFGFNTGKEVGEFRFLSNVFEIVIVIFLKQCNFISWYEFQVTHPDFKKAKDKVMLKKEGCPGGSLRVMNGSSLFNKFV